MKALIQRVSGASVTVEDQKIADIGKGLLVFVGITHGDTDKDIQFIIDKTANLRIFENEAGKLDLSVTDIKGELLVVSQFTLYGECDKGRRPDFGNAAGLDEAKATFEKIVQAFRNTGLKIEQGQFQAHMQVELVNDGPLTLMIESKK